ncbi:MAG: D-aminoacyl-tRNA deacylase [Chloroflexota bacterium]
MRAVLQRVTEASVSVDEEVIAEIGPGLVVLLGVGPGDGDEQARALAEKVANLRIFADEAGRFNLSALDLSAEVLVVSQFTLYADTRRGRRPSFTEAALPDQAEPLIERFVGYLRAAGLRTATGRFGAHMLVKIWNDGPVTISLEV